MAHDIQREREQLIAYFRARLDGVTDATEPTVRDPALKRLLTDYGDEYSMSLPLHPRDNGPLKAVERAGLERAIHFLYSDREYVPEEPDGWSATGVVFVGGLGLLAMGAVMTPLGYPWATYLAIAGGVLSIGVLFVAYALAMSVGAIHVFLVRILRRDRTHLLESEYWPYPSLAAWRDAAGGYRPGGA